MPMPSEHRSFEMARVLAGENDMQLLNPSDGCYQLRHDKGWIINIYPRRQGANTRIYHDPNHRGPFLNLPNNYDFVDVVKAAIEAESKSE